MVNTDKTECIVTEENGVYRATFNVNGKTYSDVGKNKEQLILIARTTYLIALLGDQEDYMNCFKRHRDALKKDINAVTDFITLQDNLIFHDR